MRRAVVAVESYEAYILEEAAAHGGGTQVVVVVHVGVEFSSLLCSAQCFRRSLSPQHRTTTTPSYFRE
ncbi:hypothetical protein L195_g047069 [Trifolium pratense]|uniref:Uncharacterized protein n=1 Tax=Trifolium pratense TaxID=57577 RepID=A0A2K3MJJ6_TRIPR|nr:hypothetical protein L195_g047069 [Trifolium pratense]